MNRLAHSRPGFIRAMQISQHRLWVLVEGPRDRPFYANICNRNHEARRASYEIALARELPGFTGGNGKDALLALYRDLGTAGHLRTVLHGKVTAVLFVLDKDIDDLENRTEQSEHVLYTQYLCVENYLFRFGDLVQSLAAAASLDTASVMARVGANSIQWTARAAEHWRPWVEYCLLVRLCKIRECRNFGCDSSCFHSTAYSPLDTARQHHHLNRAQQRAGMQGPHFVEAQRRAAQCAGSFYSNDQHDAIFNGKWYGKFLAEDASIAAGGRQYHQRELPERVCECLLTTLDFSQTWTEHFHQGISRLAAGL